MSLKCNPILLERETPDWDGNTFFEVLPFDDIVWEDSKKVNIKRLNFLDLCSVHRLKSEFQQNSKP